jgi:DNA-3-methyladenine glycosylase
VARIVEVEAYVDSYHGVPDLAAHSAKGVTPRTQVIFGPPGHAYVYLIYGMYECLNIVAEPDGRPGCVLIRALEPLAGFGNPQPRLNGPGKLTRSLGISRSEHYGADLTRGPLFLTDAFPCQFEVDITPRIGINHSIDFPLRFCVRNSSYVSKRVPVQIETSS